MRKWILAGVAIALLVLLYFAHVRSEAVIDASSKVNLVASVRAIREHLNRSDRYYFDTSLALVIFDAILTAKHGQSQPKTMSKSDIDQICMKTTDGLTLKQLRAKARAIQDRMGLEDIANAYDMRRLYMEIWAEEAYRYLRHTGLAY
jgi:hypothetical protein